MKNKLMKLLKAKEESRQALVAKADKSEDVNEVRSIHSQVEALNGEISELRDMIAESEKGASGGQNDERSDRTKVIDEHEEREKPKNNDSFQYTPGRGFAPLASAQFENRQSGDDFYGTLEYRKAFMEYCKTGKIVPGMRLTESRADETTQTPDVTAIIPSTILNEVINKITIYGQIFSRTRKLSIKGGVTVPILSLKPKAAWIGETEVSAKQKVQANTNVSFNYYGLECRVATSLLADTVTLSGFETIISDLIIEAMLISVEQAIIKGDGVNKALGITVDTRVPAAQKVTLSASDFLAWTEWKKKVLAKMPLAYKAGAAFFMASGTFEGYIDGMVDVNGQPVGRVNYGITNGPQERFGGKEVVLVEDDIVANYDDAASGDVVGIYCNLRNYAVNSNMQMRMYRFFDHNTNEWIDKAILIMDGKLLDPNGVVIIKKG